LVEPRWNSPKLEPEVVEPNPVFDRASVSATTSTWAGAPLTASDRARLLANRALIAAVRASPVRASCCRTLERRDPVKMVEVA
jgi:hypothetical protein